MSDPFTEALAVVGAVIADAIGASSLLDVTGERKALARMRDKLNSLAENVLKMYKQYPKAPSSIVAYQSVEMIPKDELIKMLKDALNEQSAFSKWARNYAPLGSAYDAFQRQTDSIARKVNKLQAEKELVDEKNQAIAQENDRRQREAQDKVNAALDQYNEQVRSVDSHNQNVDSLSRNIDELRNRVDYLSNASAVATTQEPWREVNDNLVKSFNNLRQEIEVMNNEK